VGWCRIQGPDGPRLGRVEGEFVETVSASSLQEVMASGAGEPDGSKTPLAAATMLVPLQPGKVIAVGQNYLDHIREQGIDPPEKPVLFAKFPSSVIGPGEEIRWTEGLTAQVDYEAELAVVIGRTAARVAPEEALDHVFGYTNANDVSARDLQFSDGQWTRGKGLDRSLPLGPTVLEASEVADPHDLAIVCRVNGETVQDGNTGEMVFSIDKLIAFISHAITLEPGDVILTGTPNGVGYYRDPQLFLSPGDTVEVEVGSFGVLSNPVGTPYAAAIEL
jgi:2-keto-4-pentenoate hydratase/2-oxohepta-3-ene-1,7-dioic acid hydratase in catechol pathway